MVQTIAGGKKAAATIKKLYGDDFYVRIGKVGGKRGTTGGFYGNPELARRAGKIGGAVSRRGKSKQSLFADEATLVDEAFGEGFFAPSWKDRVLSKIRSL